MLRINAEDNDAEWIRGAPGADELEDEEPPEQKGLDEADHRDPAEVLAEEPTTNSLALKTEVRVPVARHTDAPRGKITHKADGGGLFYTVWKSWVPFSGPRGGVGWRNPRTGDKVYQDEPPGRLQHPEEVDDPEKAEALQRVYDRLDVEPDGPDRQGGDAEVGPVMDDPGEGDVTAGDKVTFEWTGGEEEGTVEWTDGYWVDIERESGATIELSIDDVVSLDERADPVTHWGHYNEPEFEAPPEDWREAALEEGFSEETADALAEAAENGVAQSSATDLFNYEKPSVAAEFIKKATREARYEGNSAPEHLDPTNAEEIGALSEVMGGGGVSAATMDVATMPDGSKLFVSAVSPSSMSGIGAPAEGVEDAERTVSATEAFGALGLEAPDTHYEHNRFYATEGVEGPTLAEIGLGADHPPVDREQAIESMAGRVLVGDTDAHGANAAVDPDGNVVPIDMDKAGDEHRDENGALNVARRTARALSRLDGFADVEDPQAREDLAEEILEKAKGLARENPDAADAVTDPSHMSRIRTNIRTMTEDEP